MHNTTLNRELATEGSKLVRYRKRREILIRCYGENFGGRTIRAQEPRPATKALGDGFSLLSRQLNDLHPEWANRTPTERAVLEAITRATGLQFMVSLWIANRNIDLFCPAIGSLYQYCQKGQKIDHTPRMRGLAIEVDGKVHDRELKMKKDNSKLDLLSELGIGCIVIENLDIHSPTVQQLIQNLKNTPRLDTRARERLMRRIYVATLAYHASDEVMASLYGPKVLDVTVKGVA